jgi:hypothetical protein
MPSNQPLNNPNRPASPSPLLDPSGSPFTCIVHRNDEEISKVLWTDSHDMRVYLLTWRELGFVSSIGVAIIQEVALDKLPRPTGCSLPPGRVTVLGTRYCATRIFDSFQTHHSKPQRARAPSPQRPRLPLLEKAGKAQHLGKREKRAATRVPCRAMLYSVAHRHRILNSAAQVPIRPNETRP